MWWTSIYVRNPNPPSIFMLFSWTNVTLFTEVCHTVLEPVSKPVMPNTSWAWGQFSHLANMGNIYNVRPPSYKLVNKSPSNQFVIHWSYLHQLSYPTGASHCKLRISGETFMCLGNSIFNGYNGLVLLGKSSPETIRFSHLQIIGLKLFSSQFSRVFTNPLTFLWFSYGFPMEVAP